jgi:hypothetical protein
MKDDTLDSIMEYIVFGTYSMTLWIPVATAVLHIGLEVMMNWIDRLMDRQFCNDNQLHHHILSSATILLTRTDQTLGIPIRFGLLRFKGCRRLDFQKCHEWVLIDQD